MKQKKKVWEYDDYKRFTDIAFEYWQFNKGSKFTHNSFCRSIESLGDYELEN